jgi:hypothetical protein
VDQKQAQHNPAHGSERKAYETPQIVSREPLEVLAAACGQPGSKDVFNEGGCNNEQAVQS